MDETAETGGPSPLWRAYCLYDYKSIPDDEKRRLDAAEAMIHTRFGIDPAHYVRANEGPRSAKLADIIAALVLDRGTWDGQG